MPLQTEQGLNVCLLSPLPSTLHCPLEDTQPPLLAGGGGAQSEPFNWAGPPQPWREKGF